MQTQTALITRNNVMKNAINMTPALSHNNAVSNNTITNNQYYGLLFYENFNNTIIPNNIAENWAGIYLDHSSNNVVFHNNFVDNPEQTDSHASTNVWDNGVEGNYWSDYTGVDSSYDRIGNSPHIIDGTNQDNYPLIDMFSSFKTSLGYHVNVVSNSTIEDFCVFRI